jgi:hypothetical protein
MQKDDKKAAKKAEAEAAVVAAIAEMSAPWDSMGERLQALIRESAPVLEPRLWYGMPAYSKEGKIVCFFRSGDKFKERFMTLGFNDVANLDDGAMWPIYFALKDLTDAEAGRIAEIVRKAVS